MLTSTFVHLPGIDASAERGLWESGISTWSELEDAIGTDRPFPDDLASLFSGDGPAALIAELVSSRRALAQLDGRYFLPRLSPSEYWRLLPEFQTRAIYLDIETTGLSRYDELTVVGWHTEQGYHARVSGHDLHDMDGVFDGYEMVVTFNGATFDLPFLRHKFPGLRLPPIHIDLRYLLARLGLRGGLKAIEHSLGVQRTLSSGVDGREAVRLWYRYVAGDLAAMQKLLEYNSEDTAMLMPLARYAYNELRRQATGMAETSPVCFETVDQTEVLSALLRKIAAAGPPGRQRTSTETRM